MSLQWNQQFCRYVFSKEIEYFEQNIQKQIDCKRPLNIKQINRAKDHWISNKTQMNYNWFQQAFNDEAVIARCLVQYWQIFTSFLISCCYFTRLEAREISSKIWETQKIYPILHPAPCNNNNLKWVFTVLKILLADILLSMRQTGINQRRKKYFQKTLLDLNKGF